jgi:SagB-type dehydrogenase family enzyme
VARNRADVRRSPFLVTYWEYDAHVAYNYLARSSRPCSPLVVAILDAAGEWTSRARVRKAVSMLGSAREIDRTIDDLVEDGTLERSDREPPRGSEALLEWDSWNPAAGFFHAVTQSARSKAEADEVEGPSDEPILVMRDFPDPLKQYDSRPRIELPRPRDVRGKLGAVLQRRRTWREFGTRDLTLGEISTLLGRTFGVDRWIEVSRNRWVALKSSPSGGARHSIEAYLLAFDVDGLARGTYHYHPDLHALTRLGQTSRTLLRRFYRSQTWFQDPAAVIVMTSVFARVQFKYPHSHAYRAVLLDAGHLGQTFALVATALSLAPFCTAAFDVAAVERHLQVDGISESAVFLLGVGSRPAGKKWSPMPDRSTPANTAPPAWAERLPSPRFP